METTTAESTAIETLVDKVYTTLRDGIIRGDLRAGELLLEQTIADRLGTSRTPVRAAIERLKRDGLVDTVKRKGMLVKALSASDVEQAYEVAEALEGMLVKLVALRATPLEVEQLLAVVHDMVAAAEHEDLARWVECDRQFHHLLILVARNSIIAAELARVETFVERVRFLHLGIGTAPTSSREHLAVAEAIAARDGEKARQIHQAHWQRIREEIVAFLTTHIGREVLAHQIIERALRAGPPTSSSDSTVMGRS